MLRKVSLFLAIIMCFNVFPFSLFQSVLATSTVTLTPEMDTYINLTGNFPDGTLYPSSTGLAGEGPTMIVGFYEYNYDGYVCCGLAKSATKFDLSSVNGTVTDAKFRIFVAEKLEEDPSSLFIKLWGSSDDSWLSTTSVIPSQDTALSGEITNLPDDSWVEFDVTSFIQTKMSGNKKATLVLTGNTTSSGNMKGNYLYYVSSQHETYKPQLVLTVSAPTYTVTYNGNGSTGGSVPTDIGTYEQGTNVTVLGNTGSLAKTGHTFAGWNTAADGSGTDYASSSSLTMGSSNVTLYAKWERDFAEGEGTEESPYKVSNPFELDRVRKDLTAHYVQVADIDLSGTWAAGDGWEPIGTEANRFTGSYNGNSYKITNLTIDRDDTPDVGLFGYIQSATIRNVQLDSVNVIGEENTGALVGRSAQSTIENSSAVGTVSGSEESIGGLVGANFTGTISKSSAHVDVHGDGDAVGGLVGYSNGTVEYSYATGSVTGTGFAVGGLVGDSWGGSIYNSYATGAVSGDDEVGGLVGYSDETITNSYAIGLVTSDGADVGGFIGFNDDATITNSFWDTITSGQSDSDGGTANTTADMKQKATFTGWDFTTIWEIVEGKTYPTLRGVTALAHADMAPPTIVSAVVENANPNQIVVTFDEVVNVTNANGVTINVNGSSEIINSVTGSGTTELTFTIDSSVQNGQDVTFGYDQATGTITDEANNKLSSITGLEVENEIALPALAQVDNVVFSDEGVVTWDAVTNAVSYDVQLFKGGSAIDTPVNILATDSRSHDFLAVMRAEGAGEYTIKVTAKANPATHSDGPESNASQVRTIIQLATVSSGLTWDANVAKWTVVPNAVSYEVTLFKDGSEVASESVNADDASHGVDFSDAFSTHGGGIYTYKVIAKGNASLILDGGESMASNDKTVATPLAQVVDVELSNTGGVSWTAVPTAESYDVQLYKDGSPQGVVSNTTNTSLSVLTEMRAGGAGVYTVIVRAKGNGTTFSDGPPSEESSSQTIVQLAAVSAGLTWDGDIAKWTAVDDAISYDVQLYKNGTELGTPANVLAVDVNDGVDFSTEIGTNGGGTYTYRVMAKGNATLILDADQSPASNENIVAIVLDQVTNVQLSDTGEASWTAVDHASGYDLQLYKDGVAHGDVVHTTNANTSMLVAMRDAGAGVYTVTVKAKGNGTTYSDGLESSESNSQTVTKLPTVSEGLTWDENVAKWTEVASAVSYDVQLYKDGAPQGTVQNVLAAQASVGVDFSTTISTNGAGFYTYTVTAKGNATMLLDAEESQASNENRQYSVTFEVDGGDAVTSQLVAHGDVASLPVPEPTKDHHTFGGWFADSNFNTPFDFSSAITENTTIYAKWDGVTYEVTFEIDGGTAVTSQTVVHGNTASQPNPAPTKLDHILSGWYTDSALQNVFDFTSPVTSNLILYAKWDVDYATAPGEQPMELTFSSTPNNTVYMNFTASDTADGYIVVRRVGSIPTFVPSNGTTYTVGEQGEEQIISVGPEIRIAEMNVPEGQHYYYKIYAYNGSGNTISYLTDDPLQGRVKLQNGNVNTGIMLTPTNHSTSEGFPDSGVHVTFPNGTTGTTLDIEKNVTESVADFYVNPNIRRVSTLSFKITATPKETGMYQLVLDFSSLGLNPNQWDSFIIMKRDDATSPWVDVTTLGATITDRQTDGVWGKFTITGLTSFSEFAAGEEIPQYTVNFNTSGGSTVASMTAHEDTIISTPTVPTRSGYTFDGWYKESSLTNAWNFATDKVTGNTTLYAKWNAVSSGGGGGAPSPAPSPPGTVVITVPVETGNVGSGSTVTQTPINRVTEQDGRVRDEVSLVPERIRETVQNIIQSRQTTARIIIPDEEDSVSKVDVNVPREATRELGTSNISLEIFTGNVRIIVPQRSMDNFDDDLFFRVTPIKEEPKRMEVESRARVEQIVRQVAKDDKVKVVSRPMTIETNMQSRPVTLILPLRDVELPDNAAERAKYLSELIIFIEHSDGEKRLVKGRIVDYKEGQLGIEFGVNKFSTFTILHMEDFEGSFHESYVQGYEDGTFKPNNIVTRAEIAAMIARNLGYEATEGESGAPFVDVAATHWAADVIEFVKQQGYMKGDTTGKFNPNAAITRAEMAAIVARYKELAEPRDAEIAFPDISGHWALKEIAANKQAGILSGYEDGTFRPNGRLSRAEAVKVMNRMFDRGPLYGVTTPTFRDVPTTHWAFHEVEEAAQSHFYTPRAEGGEDVVK